MTIQEIFNLAIRIGIEADPRGKSRVLKLLKKERENFKDLKPEEQHEFDRERFINPYPDSRIHYGNAKKNIKRILAGIDITGDEVLLADRLNQKGVLIDLLIAHHPCGRSLAKIDSQVIMQAETLSNIGVPIHLADSHIEERVNELTRTLNPLNFYQVIDLAKILDLAFMNIHTITDNLLHKFIKNYLEKRKPETLGDIIKEIKKIPEYEIASYNGHSPIISLGSANRRCGKLSYVELTGGTNGSKNIYDGLSRAGINTLIDMHMPEPWRDEAKKHHLNIIILGHIASDSLGMNLFLDQLEAKGIEIIPCSGLIRIKRNQKTTK